MSGFREHATKREIAGILGVEGAVLVALAIYWCLVVVAHSPLSRIIYLIFVLFVCLELFLLWRVFIVRHVRYGSKTAGGRYLAIIASLSVLIGFLLELGTLVGAPLSSPARLSDWHISRLLLFFAIALPLVSVIVMHGWREMFSRWKAALVCDGHHRLKILIADAAILVVVLIACWFIADGLCYLLHSSWWGPYRFAALVVGGCLCLSIMMRRSLGIHPERIYLVVVLSAGLLLCILAPAHTIISWDDETHYARSVALSYVLDPEFTRADQVMIHNKTYNDNWWCDALGNTDNRPFEHPRLSHMFENLEELDTPDKAIQVSGAATFYRTSLIQYYTVAYIPPAIGLWLGRLLGLTFVAKFILGRIMCLILYALVTYAAIKRLKSGKMIMAVFSLIPTVVFIASSYSYDYWLNAFMIYATAAFISELQTPDEPITAKGLILMLGAALLALAPKPIYAPLLLVLFLMPKRKFSGTISRRVYFLWVAIGILAIAATFILPFLLAGPGGGDSRAKPGVNPPAQTAFILSQPFEYAKIFLSFLGSYLSPDHATEYLTNFLFLGFSNCTAVEMLLIAVVTVTDRHKVDENYAGFRYRIVPLLLMLICIMLYTTALYITFTPLQDPNPDGVQYRYLLPMLPLFLFTVCDVRLENRVRPALYNGLAMFASSFLLFYSIFQVLVLRFG